MLLDTPRRKSSGSQDKMDPNHIKLDAKTLITLWKKVTFQIIMLNKIESETKRIRCKYYNIYLYILVYLFTESVNGVIIWVSIFPLIKKIRRIY